MTGESTLPDAADRLIVLFGQAGVLVTDGQGLTDTAAGEVIQVGYGGSDDEPFAEGDATPEGLGGVRDRERYDIHCAVIVVNSDAGADGTSGDPAAARRRAMALLAQLRAALIGDSTLRGAVMSAGVTSWSYQGAKESGGVRALVRFAVRIDAFTR